MFVIAGNSERWVYLIGIWVTAQIWMIIHVGSVSFEQLEEEAEEIGGGEKRRTNEEQRMKK